jgi:hypothetical protein
MARERKPEEMTEDEIAGANGEPLPERQAMSVIRGVEPFPGLIVDPPEEVGIDPPPPPDDV